MMTDFDRFNEMVTPLVDSPEYLQAIGLVAVEINSMEFMLASVFGLTIKVSPEIGRAIYYAPKAASARVDILIEAARVAITDNPPLLSSIESVAKRAKGVFDERHRVAHDRWAIPSGATAVQRTTGASLDFRPADLAELNAIVKRARALSGRCLVLMARLTVGRHDLASWPHTIEELKKWLHREQPSSAAAD
jgi:hypothetical protein